MSRLPPLDPAKLSGRQAEVYQRIASGPRGRVRGPLAIWLHSPDFAERAQTIGEYLRWKSPISGRLTELAICIVARHWTAQFEWYVHAPLAVKEGIAQAAIDAIARGERPLLDKADERIVYNVASELLETRTLSDATYTEAVDLLGIPALVDLSGLVGYYTLGAFSLNTFSVEPGAGEGPVLSPLPRGR